MEVCLRCRANLCNVNRCDFCGSETPAELARWMRAEAVGYLESVRSRSQISVGPRSRFYAMARALCEQGLFKLERYISGTRLAVYVWTDYGRAVLEHCGCARRAA